MIGWIFKKRTAAARPAVRPDTAVATEGPDALTVRDAGLFAQPDGAACTAFLARLFTVPEIQRIDIDPGQDAARIRYAASGRSPAEILRQIAAALTDREPNGSRLDSAGPLLLGRNTSAPVSVVRHGEAVTTWQLLHELPGRVRLRHDLLVGDVNAALYVEQELKATFGVLDVSAKPLTGSVLIQFQPDQLRTDQLLRIVEGILLDFHRPGGRGYRHPYGTTAVTNTALGLGAVADFLVPALAPASAGLLVLTNLKTFRAAWRELRAVRPGCNVLYTAIVAATLASGGFFSAALMGWLMDFWDRRYHRRLSAAQWQLLADLQRQPRRAWIARQGVEIEVPVEDLQWGHVVVLRLGDMIPVDGWVMEGEARVDERLVRGVQGLSAKSKGDWVYAGSLLFDGQLKVKVIRAGKRTRAAAIGRLLEQASTPPPQPLKIRGEAFARRTVVPTLAAAGAGLAVGDVATALAILRPDYATGPGMAAPLGVLEDLYAALQTGLVVRDSAAFQRIREVDVVLLDWPPDRGANSVAAGNGNENGNGKGHGNGRSHRPVDSQDDQGLRGVSIGIVSDLPSGELERRARRLGADFWHGGLSAEQRADVVRHWTEQGKRVAFVGNCQTYAEAARAAHVAISLGDIGQHESDPAQVFALRPDLKSVRQLRDISAAGERRWRTQQGCTLVPNLLCVGGAFLLEFTSLYTVLITNAGIWTLYRQGTGWLRGLRAPPRCDQLGGRTSFTQQASQDESPIVAAPRSDATPVASTPGSCGSASGRQRLCTFATEI